ncbi:glycosyl transferase [Bordetella avium]|nr:glycosyl transferase [Bordetella avium]AZY54313.1 glycosyl transferase [Bordetella avium]RIQ12878.1 glycosyl transferase [Bordetella avium]RIQ19410.1 glycosyl transferase [Bordetella avium]RIQ32106.1 glycosyl transferase [Bordetella avium]
MMFAQALAEQTGGKVSLLMTQAEPALELFRAQPYVREVVSLQAVHQSRGWKRISDLQQVLKSKNYDALFLFSFRNHVALAARLAGIPQRVGFVRYHQPHLAALLTHRTWVRRKGTPHPDTYTWLPLVFAKAGYRFEPRYPALFCKPSAKAKAEQLLGKMPRIVGFGLNGSQPYKRYSSQGFAEVARLLHERDAGLSFLLIGGSDVAHIAQDIRALLPDTITVLDATQQDAEICDSQALIARCTVFASNDSMGMHIAVAHGVPTIGLFGATPAMRYAPWLHVIEPVGDKHMDAIAPAVVADAVWDCLASCR